MSLIGLCIPVPRFPQHLYGCELGLGHGPRDGDGGDGGHRSNSAARQPQHIGPASVDAHGLMHSLGME